jgi:hypothetical protein
MHSSFRVRRSGEPDESAWCIECPQGKRRLTGNALWIPAFAGMTTNRLKQQRVKTELP